MALQPKFGANSAAVEAFIASLNAIEWFSRVGQPTDQDERLVRVEFDFIASHHERPYEAWGESLSEAEGNIERLVFERRRTTEFMEIQEAIGRRSPSTYMDDFLTGLVDKYPGYYGETFKYAYELVEMPDRLIWGAAREIMLCDVDPNLKFFQSIMPWFRAGHFPCGWEGRWPDGRLVLW